MELLKMGISIHGDYPERVPDGAEAIDEGLCESMREGWRRYEIEIRDLEHLARVVHTVGAEYIKTHWVNVDSGTAYWSISYMPEDEE